MSLKSRDSRAKAQSPYLVFFLKLWFRLSNRIVQNGLRSGWENKLRSGYAVKKYMSFLLLTSVYLIINTGCTREIFVYDEKDRVIGNYIIKGKTESIDINYKFSRIEGLDKITELKELNLAYSRTSIINGRN